MPIPSEVKTIALIGPLADSKEDMLGFWSGAGQVPIFYNSKNTARPINPVGDVTRPVKELKGFKKVNLKKGETVKVEFTLSTGDLSYYHQDMSFSADPGDFELFIGTNSEETKKIAFSIQ